MKLGVDAYRMTDFGCDCEYIYRMNRFTGFLYIVIDSRFGLWYRRQLHADLLDPIRVSWLRAF